MECQKNLLHSDHNFVKTAKSRLMCTTAFKCVVNRAKAFFAIPARKSTTLSANLVQRRLGQGAIAPKTAQNVRPKRSAKLVAAIIKSKIISIVIIALRGAATCTKLSCTLVETTLQRLKEMATSAANATQNSRPMSTTLISQDALKRLIEKGATTT
jgi:hypothetical protein